MLKTVASHLMVENTVRRLNQAIIRDLMVAGSNVHVLETLRMQNQGFYNDLDQQEG